MKLRKVMHRGVKWVSPDTSVHEICRVMTSSNIGSVPVYDEDHIVGIVTDRDIALRALGNGADILALKARDVMSKNVVFAHDDLSLSAAVKLMKRKKVRRLPVVDDNRRMVGIVSVSDILQHAGRKVSRKLVEAVAAAHG